MNHSKAIWNIPLVVIGQQQRCGGTLLNRLLDAHPNLFVYPFENFNGRPNKYHFPQINVSSSLMEIWDNLKENHFIKWGIDKKIPKLYYDTYEFLYNGNKHKEEFIKLGKGMKNAKSILQIYYYTFFYSIENLYKVVFPQFYVYFTPRQCLYAEEFFNIFPDGHMIQIIRHPIAFYNSGKSHNAQEYSLERCKFLWRLFVIRAIDAVFIKRWQNYHTIFFEDLILFPYQTLNKLASTLNIPYSDSLLLPTLNNKAWAGDSHFGELSGIQNDVIDYYKIYLEDKEILRFSKELEIYEELKNALLNKESDYKKYQIALTHFRNFLTKYKKNRLVNIEMFDLPMK